MTVSTTSNKIVYQGNASTTTFSFPFPAVATSDIEVFFTDANGIITLLSPTQYSIALNAPISPNPTAAGGVVTYPLVGSPIGFGTLLTIYRLLPETQLVTYQNQGVIYNEVIEETFDYVTMLIQQLQELLGRGITVAVSDPAPLSLPPAAQRANLGAGFDSAGNPIAISLLPSGTVSSVMQPVVNAATLALARTNMGLGSMAVENIGAAGTAIEDIGDGNARVVFPIVDVSTNQSPVVPNHLQRYVAAGTLTFTLPRGNTTFNGFAFFCEIVSGSVTLNPDAHDTIFPGVPGGGLTISAPASFLITTDAANNASWYIDLIQGVGGSGSQVVQKSSAYGVAATNNGQTHVLNGNFTVTVGAASGFNGTFSLRWFNNGTRGVLLNINGFTPFYIYPGQTVIIQNLGASWAVEPLLQRWFTHSQSFFVDGINGSDSNDGLDSSSTGAWLTISHAWDVVQGIVDTLGSGPPAIILAAGQTFNINSIVLQGQPSGSYIVRVSGNNTLMNVAAGFNGFEVFDYATVQFDGLIFGGNGSSTFIAAHQHSIVDIDNTIFGTNVSGTGVSVYDFSRCGIGGNPGEGGVTFAGVCAQMVSAYPGGGSVSFGTQNYSMPFPISFTQFILASGAGSQVNIGTSAGFVGAGSGAASGGKPYAINYNAGLFINFVTLPGNLAGTVANGGFAV